jgi:hypothetical protein
MMGAEWDEVRLLLLPVPAGPERRDGCAEGYRHR